MFRSPESTDAHATPVVYFPFNGHGLAMSHAPWRQAPVLSTTDVASSLPDTLRCGYTSKRCENPRTVKKSGGLHRFCAYHRERANKNQWRVDNRRRQLRKMSQGAKASSDCGSPRSISSDVNEDVEHAALCDDGHGGSVDADEGDSSLMSLVDPAGSPTTLSEQDARILNAMLFSDEDDSSTVESMVASTEGPKMMTTEAALPTYHPTEYCEASISTREASWNCACSQCLAWPAVYYYADAMEAARRSRIETYARV